MGTDTIGTGSNSGVGSRFVKTFTTFSGIDKVMSLTRVI